MVPGAQRLKPVAGRTGALRLAESIPVAWERARGAEWREEDNGWQRTRDMRAPALLL